MAKVSEIVAGAEFGAWTVLGVTRTCRNMADGRKKYFALAHCRCECGTERRVTAYNLGRTSKSCGCRQPEAVTTHGVSAAKQRLYYIWHNMVRRCHKPGQSGYQNYGAKGVRVCDEWRNDVTAFVAWAEANGYTDTLTIDRIDPTGNYEPANCRWIPMSAQAGNRRNKKLLTAWGETKSVADWLRDERCVPKNRKLVCHRIHIAGWQPERALSTPAQYDPSKYVLRGEKQWSAKLSDAQVVEIKAALARGETGASLARKYGVSDSQISCIKLGKSRR